jgi:hypothetical protein
MPLVRGFFVSLCTLGALYPQSAPKQLTARELFYAATSMPAAQPLPSKAPGKSAPIAPRSNKTPAKPVEISRAETHPNSPPSASLQAAAQAAPQTAPMPANGVPPLGLRINVLRFNPDGTTADALPDTVFHSGDHIQLAVEANGRGYLYIVNQGASGDWHLMFPSAAVAGGDNRVEPMRSYTMPPYNTAAGKPRVFTFDSTAGQEKLFVVFSRQPVPDLEDLIYNLKSGKKASDNPPGQPAGPTDKSLIVAANIGDPTIARMRSAYSRDLIIETVNTSAPGEKKDTAIYVVNPTGSADSSVVADIQLVHQ